MEQDWVLVETQNADTKARSGAISFRLLGKVAAVLRARNQTDLHEKKQFPIIPANVGVSAASCVL